MRRVTVVAAIGLLLAATAALAATSPRTIRWANGKVTHIGTMRTNGSPTLTRAIRAFGTPSRRRLSGRELCRVDWNALGLRANFVNLGGARPGQTTCTPGVGKLQTATIRGTGFRTPRGLKVGDSTARLRELHPGARLRERSWWLATVPNPFGAAGDRMAIVRANTKAGKVANFVLWIGAAGE
ncbi:MAG: hypothetical protein Q8K79_06770 [Solirubrobacteraceae bacterium]|nr:hypothetical protein [Solirubrobacteraceae bacterium]